jgi:hypothetical protein
MVSRTCSGSAAQCSMTSTNSEVIRDPDAAPSD